MGLKYVMIEYKYYHSHTCNINNEYPNLISLILSEHRVDDDFRTIACKTWQT